MTADEFVARHVHNSGIELVNGRVVSLPPTGGRRGEICGNVFFTIGDYVKRNRLGRAACGGVFVRTRRNPDSVRAADMLFVSYSTLPAGVPTPEEEITPPLELVVEVRRPESPLLDMVREAVEYTDAGVKVAVVVDPITEAVGVFRADEWPARFETHDTFTLPDILPGFAVPVKAFFE